MGEHRCSAGGLRFAQPRLAAVIPAASFPAGLQRTRRRSCRSAAHHSQPFRPLCTRRPFFSTSPLSLSPALSLFLSTHSASKKGALTTRVFRHESFDCCLVKHWPPRRADTRRKLAPPLSLPCSGAFSFRQRLRPRQPPQPECRRNPFQAAVPLVTDIDCDCDCDCHCHCDCHCDCDHGPHRNKIHCSSDISRLAYHSLLHNPSRA